MIERLDDGRWLVDVEPVKGRRFRRKFKTKGEAQRFESTCRANCIQTPDWSPRPKDRRLLAELVSAWYDLHGVSLSDGKRRKAILDEVATMLGNPVALTVDGAAVASVRADWISNGVSGKTANNRLGYLKAVYNTLRRLDVIDYDCPFGRLQSVKLQERPLSYLTAEQIRELLAALDARAVTSPHPAMVARLCLATGARWGEAQAVGPDQLRDGRVVFANTKSKRVRAVPVSAQLRGMLREHWRRHGPFTQCLETFRRVLLSTSIRLPVGQASHVLRHTFASHFVMGGGNVLVLQKILGHASLTMTLRYSHLSPDHLEEAVLLNPFDTFSTLPDSRNDKAP